ncbi:hypothetical protein TNCV_2300761 [Trichonephila clavipes]|nr:hypothetical protein TNCV_2300761 [Trichonephila clavipes]
MALQHLNFCSVQSIAKLPKMMPIWLYCQHFDMFPLNRHYSGFGEVLAMKASQKLIFAGKERKPRHKLLLHKLNSLFAGRLSDPPPVEPISHDGFPRLIPLI